MNKGMILGVLSSSKALCTGTLQENGDKGMRCVIGELLWAQGYTNKELSSMSGGLEVPLNYNKENDEYDRDETSLEAQALRTLADVYDIDEDDVTNLIEVNDDFEDEDTTLKAHLIDYITNYEE